VREIVSLGARSAIMTMPDGCWAQMLTDGSPRVYRVTVPMQDSVATVGSGDACLAGYVAAHYRGETPAECLRFGVACGAESTGRLGAGLIDVHELDRLLADVAASEVELPAGVG
jgi:1-phosphofructokinase/tagatose 6-phosphate kinase